MVREPIRNLPACRLLLVLLSPFFLGACDPNSSTEPSDLIIRLASLDRIEIQILESFPVQVAVVAHGHFPDGCTGISEVTQTRREDRFLVVINTARPADANCTQALVPFEERIPLQVLDLPAGTYTVDVNGITSSFTLAVDNVPPE